ncbi:hypothetical protein ANOM_000681 [Aspergillus nomiae NRRL 13137]|uniref:Carboxylic ester hydrolase n=1 Tax=Aspergillus nomiae NRRL (strain ATCC 15546 / NRRL 13137 / CBS 260.88 / M93) TaxID=1509407 RepID=A0A0L1JGV0_ASPN3|nr:uncharacterized protein ANOM_000681 [Aspergillus nomiae NRRL 13137]KNG90989.1 hypothetical protein ANOM_000681 [Aspergillus nomiae NRRL 13137]
MQWSILPLAGLVAGVYAAKNCTVARLTELLPENSTVFYANDYPAHYNFTPPVSLNYGSTSSPRGISAYELPVAACIAQANITLPNNTQHSVGFVLPDDWNGRFLANGNGEFSGSIGWDAIVSLLALQNWGHVALHNAVGLKEVEEYPEDFDGVIAGAPAWWTSHQQLWNVLTAIWNLPETADYHVTSDQMSAVAAEILKQCDPQDGVKDNILQNPFGCVLDITTLACNSTSSNDTCLTSPQIGTVNKLFNPWVDANDTFVFPGYTLGTEVGAPSLDADFVTYIQYMLQLGGDWTWEDWNSQELIALSEKLNPGNATADNFNISPFYEKGGKLIHYHGYSDPSIATGSSFYFFNHVVEALKPKGIPIESFYRFFPVPGMEHCTFSPADQNAPYYFNGADQSGSLSGTHWGVPGFNDSKHDIVLAIMDWVENGTTPDYLIPTKWWNDDPADGVEIQRPICPYPQLALYNGTGNTSLPENWHCGTLY